MPSRGSGKARRALSRAKQHPRHKVPRITSLAKLRRFGSVSDTINETVLKKNFYQPFCPKPDRKHEVEHVIISN